MKEIRLGLAAIVFVLLSQNAIAQEECLEALQRLDALQLLQRLGQAVFKCETSGAWSLSVGSNDSGTLLPGFSRPLVSLPNLNPAKIRAYKKALCVAGSGAQTDFVDDDTVEQFRQFIAGDGWKNAQDAAPGLDDALGHKLDKAVQLFSECNVQSGQIRNAYELGVYSREVNSAAAGIANVENTLGLAAKTLNVQGAKTGRPAIESLRAELERRNRLGKVDEKRDQLDDKLWPVLVACAALADVPDLPGSRAGMPSSPC